MFTVVFYKITQPRSKGKPITLFRTFIMPEDSEEEYEAIFEDIRAAGLGIEICPIVLEGKSYDFTYHDSLKEAQTFVEKLGYVINSHNPHEGIWNGKIFKVQK